MKRLRNILAKLALFAVIAASVLGRTDLAVIKAYGASFYSDVVTTSLNVLSGELEGLGEDEILKKSWEVYTLSTGGKLIRSVRDSYVSAAMKLFRDEDVAAPTIAAGVYATTIIALRACGEDVRDFGGKDMLIPFKDVAWIKYNGGGWSGCTTLAYAVKALEAGGAGSEYGDVYDSLVDEIMMSQESDGGFGWGFGGDYDTTGMVIEGLASYRGAGREATVSEAVRAASGWVKEQKLNENGLYEAWGAENAASTATVAIGLMANGLDPLSYMKSESKKTVVDGLLHVYNGDGTFGGYDFQAQSLRALAALKKYYVEPKPKDATEPSGGGKSGSYEKPSYTGTWGAPVSDGTWTLTSNGWQYRTNAVFRSTWAYITNPFSVGEEKNAWFRFDENGIMLTGWQYIKDINGTGRWYYLNPVSDGTLGACWLNTVTPDGYTVNENGAWTVNGVLQ